MLKPALLVAATTAALVAVTGTATAATHPKDPVKVVARDRHYIEVLVPSAGGRFVIDGKVRRNGQYYTLVAGPKHLVVRHRRGTVNRWVLR